jgi:hypothetical protein
MTTNDFLQNVNDYNLPSKYFYFAYDKLHLPWDFIYELKRYLTAILLDLKSLLNVCNTNSNITCSMQRLGGRRPL